MRHLSLFSGAGGFEIGMERAGIESVGQVELDSNASAVLERHWPRTPRWRDVRQVAGCDLPQADIVTFGSPCQDMSTAGSRAGIGGERSSLFFDAIRVIREMREAGNGPTWAVWENVVGALSSGGGRDFGAAIGALAELGALDIRWRVLDAQAFGVPQRRRRVFVVADFGGRRADQVLADGCGSSWCAQSGAQAWDRIASPVIASAGKDKHPFDRQTYVIAAISQNQRGEVRASPVVPSIATGGGTIGQSYPAVIAFNTLQTPCVSVESSYAIGTSQQVAVQHGETIRRLTPRECERLMGWPDDHTRWRSDGSEIGATARMRLIGNGVVAPVAEWIGQRIWLVVGPPAR